MAERCVTEVVAHADRFDEIFVQAKSPADRTPNLSDLQCVREPGAIVVAGGSDEDLCFVLEAPKTLRVDDPIAVPLKWSSDR